MNKLGFQNINLQLVNGDSHGEFIVSAGMLIVKDNNRNVWNSIKA